MCLNKTYWKKFTRWIRRCRRAGLYAIPTICFLQGVPGSSAAPDIDVQRLIKISLLPMVGVIVVIIVFLALRNLLIPKPLDSEDLDPEALKLRMESLAKEKLAKKILDEQDESDGSGSESTETETIEDTSQDQENSGDLEGESLV